MQKLKHLFKNEDLAEMLLRNWKFDEGSLELFKYYRISSNAIFPTEYEGEVQFLRYAPVSEKHKTNVLAELEFISYLNKQNYDALEPIRSIKGKALVEAETPWGTYYASMFECVPGIPISRTEFNDAVIFHYGKALGRLHHLSSLYEPETDKRWSYREVLDWAEAFLMDSQGENATDALKEVALLREYFKSCPISKETFGLIHYDFECDNVFYDENTEACFVIDFDDTMYHWYAMDIEQALDSLQDEAGSEGFSLKRDLFLEGYGMEFKVTDQVITQLPACRRFANLYGYVRLLRAISEKWEYEPEWLIQLREKIQSKMKSQSQLFGKEI